MPPYATAALSYLKRTAVPGRGQDPRRQRRRRVLLGLAGGALVLPFVGLATVAALMLSLLAPAGSEQPTPVAGCDTLVNAGIGGAPAALASRFTGEQLGNAQTIIETARQQDVPTYGWIIAVATAIQESSLRSLSYGDAAGPDSRGLFQQRAAWGPERNRMDPARATTYFFTGGGAGQRGLLDVPNWQSLPLGVAAQAVQGSADSTGTWYAQHEPTARALVEQLSDGTYIATDCGIDPAFACPPTNLAVESGLTPDALLVLRCLVQEFAEIETYHGVGERPSGGDGHHAAGRAVDAMIPDYTSTAGNEFGWRVAEWLRERHAQLGITYIIWDEQIWSVRRSDQGWRPYDHFQGCDSDTCRHVNHVHVSTYGNAARSAGGATGDWMLPVAENGYNLTARFGQCGGPWASCHTGLDFAASGGTSVRAAAAGTVTHAGPAGAYGNLIRIDHGDGVVTSYAHLSGFVRGVAGARVQPGTVIGYVGSTGNSSGPHLHFEVRTGTRFQDPEQWLRDHGVDP